MRHYTKTGKCRAWGSSRNARRVVGLTPDERALVRAGGALFLANCPYYKGETDRLIIWRGDRFYTRMPRADK